MNEEKRKAECGEAEQISGGKECAVGCTREAVENTGKVKEEKAQNLNSPTPENESAASMEKAKRYFINEYGLRGLNQALIMYIQFQ